MKQEGKTMFLFKLKVKDITELDPTLAVDLFRRLLWAEAGITGIAQYLIDVPDCLNVGDGGIDALIKDVKPISEDLIPSGTTGFQIKSTDLKPSKCKKELYVGENIGGEIKPEIKKVLDHNGTYVLVLFADITSPKKLKREKAIHEELIRAGYSDPKVRVYSAGQLAGFMEKFYGLVSLLRPNIGECLSYSVWSENQVIKIPKHFVPDEKRKEFIQKIREELRDPKGKALIFRITGLAGMGKTRLAFEILAPDDLQNRVIYVKADRFSGSNLYYDILNDNSRSAIIVIDECDLSRHQEFVNFFSQRGPRVAIFTISDQMSGVPPPSVLWSLTPLEKKAMEDLLKVEYPAFPSTLIDRISQFADGYPRIAVLLSESYSFDRPSDFHSISDENLINRLMSGSPETTSDDFKETKKVLTGLSLFGKIGYERGLDKEAKWLTQFTGVEWDKFKDIIHKQKQRGIIQGDYYLYVSPFMLKVHLIKDWWEIHGFTKESFESFIESIPEEFRTELLNRFLEHIPFINTTKHGKEFTVEILGDKGLFSDGQLLKSELGSDFFLKLSEADPQSALKCLSHTVGRWGKSDLYEFAVGRRQVVWALEKIAVWKELLPDAARLLLALAETENEKYSNNASGVFAELFSPFAATEASLMERFEILKEALNSTSKEVRLLALRACDEALESEHYARSVGPEYQGLKREPKLWYSTKKREYWKEFWEELLGWFQKVWILLSEQIDALPEDEQKKSVHILLNQGRGLTKLSGLSEMVIDSFRKLSQKPFAEKKKILAKASEILHYDGKELSPVIREKWEELKEELTGKDFSSLLKRYVGMNLLEDKFDEEGNQIDQTENQIEQLAEQALKEIDNLKKELPWLITTEAENGFRFGYKLGFKDRDFSSLPILLDALRNSGGNVSDYFLGGYFRALFEKDPVRWEKELDDLINDKQLNTWIPELTWRSGISDRAALRILGLAKGGLIPIGPFRIFAWGSVINKLSENVFTEWIEFLLSSDEPLAVSIALELFSFYYAHPKPDVKLPKQLTLKLLTHELLFEKLDRDKRGQRDDYEWTIIGITFVRQYREASLELADKIIEHFGKDGTIFEGFHSETQKVLKEITIQHPVEVWKKVAKYLGPPIDSRAYHLKEWLKGGRFSPSGLEGIFPLLPLEEIWAWVDEDIEKRAWYIADMIPSALFREKERICIAREVLVRYGDRKDVRNNLCANFMSGSFEGPMSLHYHEKKQFLLDFEKDEIDTNVKRWIDEVVSYLDKGIQHAIIEEERRGF